MGNRACVRPVPGEQARFHPMRGSVIGSSGQTEDLAENTDEDACREQRYRDLPYYYCVIKI
jgi:hypothetical protein